MDAHLSQAKFFINLGDLVEEGQNYDHWNTWFEAAKGVINAIPTVPVLGNHETYVPNSEINSKPIFWLAQFKVPLNGHDHGLSRTYSIYQNKLVKGGNPGAIYYITGRSGHKVTKNLFPKDYHAFFYNLLDQPNYLVITVQRDSLVIKAFKQDGTLLDSYPIFK